MTSLQQLLSEVDFVPPFVPEPSDVARLTCMQYNDALTKCTTKEKSKNFRNTFRNQRINVDWLWERIRTDPGISMMHVRTKLQIVDILIKAQFTSVLWKGLCALSMLCDVPNKRIPVVKESKNVVAHARTFRVTH